MFMFNFAPMLPRNSALPRYTPAYDLIAPNGAFIVHY